MKESPRRKKREPTFPARPKSYIKRCRQGRRKNPTIPASKAEERKTTFPASKAEDQQPTIPAVKADENQPTIPAGKAEDRNPTTGKTSRRDAQLRVPKNQ